MRLEILDVGHGFCAWLQADNGNTMLFDCGHKSHPELRPSVYLPSQGCHRVDLLFITNYDEDHISDLPRLSDRLPVSALHRNKSISPSQLRQLKLQSGPISEAMACLLGICESYTHDLTDPPVFPGISYTTYHNDYPEFTDTNNLSFVTFLACNGTTFLLPGDLETAGWRALLERASFRSDLARVGVLVAPHHGRANGYCAEVFDYCRPNVIIFSDSDIKHATQEMAGVYGQHANGIQFDGRPRRVLTTRQDRSLTWTL